MDWTWGVLIALLIIGAGVLLMMWRQAIAEWRDRRRERRDERREERRDERKEDRR
jgi:hypothetical protein